MIVDHPGAAGALVEVVDILGDDRDRARPWKAPLQPRQSKVRGVRFDRPQRGPSQVVEPVHQHRIAPERLRARHILDPVPFHRWRENPVCIRCRAPPYKPDPLQASISTGNRPSRRTSARRSCRHRVRSSPARQQTNPVIHPAALAIRTVAGAASA